MLDVMIVNGLVSNSGADPINIVNRENILNTVNIRKDAVEIIDKYLSSAIVRYNSDILYNNQTRDKVITHCPTADDKIRKVIETYNCISGRNPNTDELKHGLLLISENGSADKLVEFCKTQTI